MAALKPWIVASGVTFVALGLMPRDHAWGQAQVRVADAPEASECALSEEEIRWIQQALDGWDRVARDILRYPRSSLPWIVLFDRSCAWHLAPDEALLPEGWSVPSILTFAGDPVPVQVVRHDGAVWLPSGSPMPVRGAAFASLYERASGDGAPFFVLALPEIWWEEFPGDPDLEAEILGVASHELVHTLQIPHLARRLDELKGRYALPERIRDDVVEERFAEVADFRDAHERETDLLYRAVSQSDRERKRELVRQALELARARQDKYFQGPDAAYRELEELFLNMEGVAVWAAFKLSQIDPAFDIGIEDPVADRRRNTWSQDQGLAFFLLIDELVPGWRSRVLGPELASPFDLLEEAVSPSQS